MIELVKGTWAALWATLTDDQKKVATDGGAEPPAPVVVEPSQDGAAAASLPYSEADYEQWQGDNAPGTLPEVGCQCAPCKRVWSC